jgi:hypothetical protein
MGFQRPLDTFRLPQHSAKGAVPAVIRAGTNDPDYSGPRKLDRLLSYKTRGLVPSPDGRIDKWERFESATGRS